MMHIRYAEQSLLLGDEVVDLMMEYAVLLAQHGSADRVQVAAIGTDGEPVTATLLLGPATIMVAETARAAFDEPDNGTAVESLTGKIDNLKNPPFAHGLDEPGIIGIDGL